MVRKTFLPAGLALLANCLGMGTGMALQARDITENGTAVAEASRQEPTRVAIAQDRIVRVRGAEGAYEIKTDPVQGAVFVRPVPGHAAKPFTLFLATEQNHNYALRLVPTGKLGDTVLLRPKASQNKDLAYSENPAPSARAAVALIRAMANGVAPPSQSAAVAVAPQYSALWPELDMRLVQVYRAPQLQGGAYRLTNLSDRPLRLSPPAFYQNGDLAIAFSRPTLAPKGEAWLYKVKNYG